MLRNRIAQSGGRNEAVKTLDDRDGPVIHEEGNVIMSGSVGDNFVVAAGIATSPLAVPLAPAAIVAGAAALRIEAEKAEAENAVKDYRHGLLDIKSQMLLEFPDMDESTRAALDSVIDEYSRKNVTGPLVGEEIVMGRGTVTRIRTESALAQLAATLHTLIPTLTFDAHTHRRAEMGQSRIDAAQTSEKLRAQGLLKAIDYDVARDGSIDLEKALLHIADTAASSSAGSFEDAARAFEEWAARIIPLMQDEVLDMTLRNRLSAKFEIARASFSALGPDSSEEQRLAAMKILKDFEHVMKSAQHESNELHEQYEEYRLRVDLLNERYHRPTVLRRPHEIEDLYAAVDAADAALASAAKDEYIERCVNEVMAEHGADVVRYAVMDGSGKPWRLIFDTNKRKAVAVLKGSHEQQLVMRVVEADPSEFSEDPVNPTVIKDVKAQDQATVDKVVQDQVEFCDFYQQFKEDLKERGVVVASDAPGHFVRPADPQTAVEIHPHDYVPPTPSADAERRLRNRRQASQLKQREMR